jgi:hypothetical protein
MVTGLKTWKKTSKVTSRGTQRKILGCRLAAEGKEKEERKVYGEHKDPQQGTQCDSNPGPLLVAGYAPPVHIKSHISA